VYETGSKNASVSDRSSLERGAQGKGLATGARVKEQQTETGSRESELPAYGLIALSDWPWAA
jgi:hypothetical protein